ncbi:hypothetical protein U9M48_034825 [Paspalum notatum var. saurae]|uniref:Synergin gamma C-terminal domain-containing protein n=1 Tax=Paspalum notatum var. saurae TaxID=547442 RepID=A0AAQ3U9S4_PASNO
MDAVAFPPPPAPFLDDDLDFGDFAFASAPAPQPPLADPRPAAAFAAFDDDWGDFVAGDLGSSAGPPAPPTAAAPSSSWEKPRGPLPLSLFGADEDDGDGLEEEEEEEGPAGPPPTATAHQHGPYGARQADLKDLIAGLYGSRPPPAAGPEAAGTQQEADQGFGDDDWEFTAAAAGPADQDGGGRGDGIAGNVEDITKSLSTDQEDWSSFTSVDEKLNHVHQTTDIIGIHESTGECVKASPYSPANSSAILDLYKESKQAEPIHIAQSSAESLQSSSALFYNNDMKSSFGTDENQSSRSTSDGILIEFYHRLREESLIVISRHVKELRDAQKVSTPSDDENSKSAGIGREIQEIYDKLKDYSLPEGFCTEEHPSKDVCITELLNYTKEEHLKDFEQEHCLAEKIAWALEDVNMAVELYKHSVSTLQILKLLSKEQGDYVSAWYSLLLPCAQELQHGAALWQESYYANVCDRVISEGGHYFIALGEIYRVAQILYFSMQCFKPWVLAVPGMLSKMLSCWDSCTSSWNSALMESIKNITNLEVLNLQKNIPNEMQCRLTLLPTSLVPGLKVVMWNADQCFVKVANLWANRISPDPPQLSRNATSSIN